MFLTRRDALAERRAALLARSAVLRARLQQQAQVLDAPLALADRGVAGLCWLRRHPQVPLAAVAVVVVLRPRRAWRLAVRAWALWRSLRWLLDGRRLLRGPTR